MDAHDAEALGRPEIAGDGRDGTSADRGREGDDLEILYGHLGSRDRGLLVILLLLIAWPTSWVRIAFVVMVCAAEVHLKNTDVKVRGIEIKAWERRVVSLFSIIMAMSKLVWWTVACSMFVLGLRVLTTHVVLSDPVQTR